MDICVVRVMVMVVVFAHNMGCGIGGVQQQRTNAEFVGTLAENKNFCIIQVYRCQ
jgi:hypothetical protein